MAANTTREVTMGDFVAHTEQWHHEQAERQRDPEFLAWLAAMDAELDRLVREDAPELGKLDSPWTAEGLQVIAQTALRQLPDFAAAPLAGEPFERFQRFARGIGHIFRTCCDGQWKYAVTVSLPGEADRPVPVVEIASSPVWFDPQTMLAYVLFDHTDTILLDAFEHATTDHREWIAAGRPAPAEWLQLR
ncbi:hypothetical protein [Nocardia acidivorans]|uniref:hypothetical protein n=1 Tax=Nocardia acidivorans TaxID=404580 RepID=UPI00082CB0BE|nr:hypothetical protein [Nocardia acidivorans]